MRKCNMVSFSGTIWLNSFVFALRSLAIKFFVFLFKNDGVDMIKIISVTDIKVR